MVSFFLTPALDMVTPHIQPLSDMPAAISILYYVLNMDERAVEPDC